MAKIQRKGLRTVGTVIYYISSENNWIKIKNREEKKHECFGVYKSQVFLGIVEGITEWLPISSTGHMILVDEFIKMDMTAEFKEFFLVVIQLGAILEL